MLGPRCFLFLLNYLPSYVISKYNFFADDMKIYLKMRHRNIVHMPSDLSSCQRSIDTLVDVTSSWGLQLSVEKCYVTRFAQK